MRYSGGKADPARFAVSNGRSAVHRVFTAVKPLSPAFIPFRSAQGTGST
jgi:hypothetical protein